MRCAIISAECAPAGSWLTHQLTKKHSANFASMSVDELWEIYEELLELLEAKILAEKAMLERQENGDKVH